MRLKCISCDALARIVYLCAATSPHLVDISMFRLGLHRKPADLQTRLQQEIDANVGQGYDAIVMVYGLCGRATAGLTARDVPVVVPRAHDCITLFLGGRARYNEQHQTAPGTYWYALDYIERGSQNGEKVVLGAAMDGFNVEEMFDEYVAKYGKDNADYLLEVLGGWQNHYQRAAFIDMGIGDGRKVEEEAQAEAAKHGWAYERLAGDSNMVRRLLNGDWNEDFLVLQPGQSLGMSYDEGIIKADNA